MRVLPSVPHVAPSPAQVRAGLPAYCKVLMAASVEPDAPCPDGSVALHVAMAHGQADVMRALLDGRANPSVTTDNDRSALGTGIVTGAPSSDADGAVRPGVGALGVRGRKRLLHVPHPAKHRVAGHVAALAAQPGRRVAL